MRPIALALVALLLVGAGGATVYVLTRSTPEPLPVVWMVYAGEPGSSPYIDAARQGLLRAAQNRTFTYDEFWPATAARLEVALANTSTAPPALVVVQDSGSWVGAADRWAESRPFTRFVVVDGEAGAHPNVRNISFSTHGVSYLAGALAATAAGGRPVAVLLGMPHPVLDGFRDGFRAGAEAVVPGGAVEIRYVGNDLGGYTDPDGAAAIADTLYRDGTAVVYAACGGSSLGVIRAAGNGTGRFVIGVDRDQSQLGPDVVLGSALKNQDRTVQAAIEEGLVGEFSHGPVRAGLSEGATALVMNPRFAAYGSVFVQRRAEAEALDR